MLESTGLVSLDWQECLRLLSTVPVGRIVFTHRALPAVQPVNYVRDGEAIVIRTAAGSKLAAAAENAVVAFEIDDIDFAEHRGWSVTAVGRAEIVTDAAERERLDRLPLRPWAPGQRDHFIRIPIEILNGRRLVRGAQSTEEPLDGSGARAMRA